MKMNKISNTLKNLKILEESSSEDDLNLKFTGKKGTPYRKTNKK